MGLPWWLSSKEFAFNAGDEGSIPRSGRRARQTTPVFLPGVSHGQGSLVGYSLWGQKESDMTEATWHVYTHVSPWVSPGLLRVDARVTLIYG